MNTVDKILYKIAASKKSKDAREQAKLEYEEKIRKIKQHEAIEAAREQNRVDQEESNANVAKEEAQAQKQFDELFATGAGSRVINEWARNKWRPAVEQVNNEKKELETRLASLENELSQSNSVSERRRLQSEIAETRDQYEAATNQLEQLTLQASDAEKRHAAALASERAESQKKLDEQAAAHAADLDARDRSFAEQMTAKDKATAAAQEAMQSAHRKELDELGKVNANLTGENKALTDENTRLGNQTAWDLSKQWMGKQVDSFKENHPETAKWISDNKKPLIGGGVALAGLATAGLVYNHMKKKRRQKRINEFLNQMNFDA